MSLRSIRAIVRGRVQGVGFRYWTQQRAQDLGLSGSVRNRPDGSVEVLIAGPDAACVAMVEALRTGPGHARVEAVETEDAPAPGTSGFQIRR